MRVREIINALIGVPGDVELEIVDANGIAAELLDIKISQSYGSTYCVGTVDRLLLADDETAVKA